MAGSTGEEIFSSEAIEAVHHHAGGILRITNLLCEHALISASCVAPGYEATRRAPDQGCWRTERLVQRTKLRSKKHW